MRGFPKFLFVGFCVLLSPLTPFNLCNLLADPPTPTSHPSTKVDLSDPKQSYITFLTAMLNDDTATIKACLYFSKEVNDPLIDDILDSQTTERHLVQTAINRFGEDGKRLIPYAINDDDLRKQLAKMPKAVVQTYGEMTILTDDADPFVARMHVMVRKIDGQWKQDRSGYIVYLSQHREAEQKKLRTGTACMQQMMAQLKEGKFKDIDEAKFGFELMKNDSFAPSTQTAAASQPHNRWLEKAAQPGCTMIQKAVYQRLAQVQFCKLEQMSVPGTYEIDSPFEETPNPASSLARMGLDAVPTLTEALDDSTMTPTTTRHGNGSETQHRVNDIVVRLIRHACERDFVLGSDPNAVTLESINGHPNLIPLFQQAVVDWYKASRHKTSAERKIADVEDGWFRNRLDAIEWLAEHKIAAGSPAIVKYIDRTFIAIEQRDDTLKESELSECSIALGIIGDKEVLPSVQKVCKFYSKIWDERHRPLGSMGISDLFQAYQGLALLGEKDTAVKELTRLFESYQAGMEAMSSKEFKESLDKAAKW